MRSNELQPERPVLIVSDDSAFAQSIVERWQEEPSAPRFRIAGSADCLGFDRADFRLVVVGRLHPDACARALDLLAAGETPVIVVGAEGGLREAVEQRSPAVPVLAARQGWRDTLVLLEAEVLRRAEAQARAQRAEMANAALQCDARLGQYMIDVRHNLNNALTSVLGNAELLLLDETRFSRSERCQMDTIRIMALRMHETLQRFSSLEKELRSAGHPNAQEVWPSAEGGMSGQDRQDSEESGQGQLARAAGAD